MDEFTIRETEIIHGKTEECVKGATQAANFPPGEREGHQDPRPKPKDSVIRELEERYAIASEAIVTILNARAELEQAAKTRTRMESDTQDVCEKEGFIRVALPERGLPDEENLGRIKFFTSRLDDFVDAQRKGSISLDSNLQYVKCNISRIEELAYLLKMDKVCEKVGPTLKNVYEIQERNSPDKTFFNNSIFENTRQELFVSTYRPDYDADRIREILNPAERRLQELLENYQYDSEGFQDLNRKLYELEGIFKELKNQLEEQLQAKTAQIASAGEEPKK